MARLAPVRAVLRDDTPVVVRAIEAEDAAAVLAFARHAASSTEQILTMPGELPASVTEEARHIKACLDAPGTVFIGALPEGEPGSEALLGTLHLIGAARARAGHTATLGMITHPDHRGRGIGTALIRVALDWAAAHPDIEKVWLHAFADNDGAIRLYERFGFEHERTRRAQGRRLRNGRWEYADEASMGVWVKGGPEGVPRDSGYGRALVHKPPSMEPS